MATCTINGEQVLRASVVIPRWGIWHAELEVATTKKLDPKGRLLFAGIDAVCTISEGGAYEGRSYLHAIGSNAGDPTKGWAQEIPPDSFRSAAGVKLSSIVERAAGACGEKMTGVSTETRVPSAFVEPRMQAARVLDLLAKENWYVGLDGLTRIGVRPTTPYTKAHTLIDNKPNQQRIVVATEDLVGLEPGATLHGIEVATVRHELTPDMLRTQLWGLSGVSPTDRLWQGFARWVGILQRPLWYHGMYAYRVVGGSGGFLDVRPENRDEHPDLANVPVRVGVYGARGTPRDGSGVLVGFVNGDPSRPYVHSFEGQWGSAAVAVRSDIYADAIDLGGSGGNGVARIGDSVNCGYLVLSNPTTLDSYFEGTQAGETAAQQRVTDLGGPPAVVFPLNNGDTEPSVAKGGSIIEGSSIVKAKT